MKNYFIGTHDLETFPDILLAIEHEDEVYEIPFGPRTYSEISRDEFLKNERDLERRNIKQ